LIKNESSIQDLSKKLEFHQSNSKDLREQLSLLEEDHKENKEELKKINKMLSEKETFINNLTVEYKELKVKI
jgi:chromosome segregation ATPase